MRCKAYGTSTHSDRQARPQTANSNSRRQNVVETKKPKPNVFIASSQVVGEVGLVVALHASETSYQLRICDPSCYNSSTTATTFSPTADGPIYAFRRSKLVPLGTKASASSNVKEPCEINLSLLESRSTSTFSNFQRIFLR